MRSKLIFLGIAVILLASCRTPRWVVDDLSMRFAHPELYEGRDDFARENALAEMQRVGLLRRGMTKDEVRALLGSRFDVPARAPDEDDDVPEKWSYGLNSSGLLLEFDRDDRATKFGWYFDEGGPKPLVW